MDNRGFTLIELILVIVLVSIVAALAAPVIFGGRGRLTTAAMAAKVKDDIRYTQSLAMQRNRLDTPNATNPSFTYRIRFNVPDANCPGADQYTIVNDADNNGTWGENPNSSGVVESARVPATGASYFCVQLVSGDYKGFTISADFGGSVPGILEFDGSGIPYNSDHVKLAAMKSIIISKDGVTSTATVTPNTGMVTVQ